MNLYCLYDKIGKRYSHFALAENDSAYVREMIAHRVSYPMNFDDFVPVLVCDEVVLSLDVASRIEWSSWRAPETKADLLRPLQMTSDELKSVIDRSDENDRKRQQQQEASDSSDS